MTDGLTMLEDRTGIPVAGVVHHYRDIHIPEEDSVALDIPMRSGDSGQGAALDIAVIQLPHISNFDDFDPLAREPGVSLRYVSSAGELGNPDLVILPGSKTTIPDLAWMNSQGLSRAVQDLHNRGAAIVGICGGYQMLGHRLYDPDGIESSVPEMEGLGILPLTTVFAGTKETHRIRGEVVEATGLLKSAGGASLTGYEIHMGRTTGEGVALPFLINDRTDVAVTPETAFDGAMDESGSVLGTYIHGLFHNVQLRRAILEELAGRNGRALPAVAELEAMDTEFDKLADWVRGSLDMDLIYGITGLDRNFDRIGSP